MSAAVAEAIRQTRRTLAEKTWVPCVPVLEADECCLVSAFQEAVAYDPIRGYKVSVVLCDAAGVVSASAWNDRQTDVGAVLGMTLEALIAEMCKRTA